MGRKSIGNVSISPTHGRAQKKAPVSIDRLQGQACIHRSINMKVLGKYVLHFFFRLSFIARVDMLVRNILTYTIVLGVGSISAQS